jgi:hypothetical protein
MAMLIDPIDPCSRAVQMVPGRTLKTRSYNIGPLRMEELLILNQQIGELTCRDLQADRLQDLQDLWLAHPAFVV